MNWLGDYPEDFTTVAVYFTTHDGNGAPVAPLSAFETADVKIFKNGSATEKTSTNGLTMTSPFNGSVGLHCLLIDTSNDTGDAAFWVAGAVYSVLLDPDTETVNGQVALKIIGSFGLALAGSSSAPSAATIADAVWDEARSGHVAGGSFGEGVASVTGAVGSVTGAVGSVTGLTASDVGAIKTKTDFLPSATAGSAGGVFIAGTNAATVVTTSFTTTFTGNLTGSVASVSGAVGSVTGLTAADVGAIKTKTDFLPSATAGAAGGVFIAGTNAATTVTTAFTTTFTGNLTGSVASVSGAVGSVTGLTAADVGAIKTKTDFLPSATAGASGGVFIAGTNAATVVTTSFTTTFTGNLTGSVASVAGAVGSVTGNVGGNVTGTVGSVVGAVGSVTGNVGGNVTGTIGGLTAAALKDFFDTDSTTTYASAVSGSVVKEIAANAGGTGLTASDIADEVETRTIAAVTTVNGLAANTVTASALAADAVTEIQSGLATASALSTLSGKVDTIDDFLDTEVAAILADTNELQTDWANGGRLDNILDARASQASVDTIDGIVDSILVDTGTDIPASIDALPTNAELATALGTADDAVLAAVGALTIPTANQNADALLDRADAIETGLTPRQAMRLSAAADGGKLSGGATTTNTIRNAVADDKDRIIATVTADGDRTSITYDLT